MRDENEKLTEHIDSEMCIDRREESVDEMNKPPCEVECDSDWKQNDTITTRVHKQKKILV